MSDIIGKSLGRYHILEKLGVGGMATVYKAYDTRLERDVAVKIIRREAFPPEQIEHVLKRFEREAKALAHLTHTNIVSVIDYGEYEGAPYLVMTYLPGGTLKPRLGSFMSWQEAVRILLPIAQALAYAHEHNIIHRDVKPSNILLTEKGQPMLSDFGIAKILESEETQTLTGTGVGIGTPEYMAPEQWTGQSGQLSDLYSLGVVLYELVTGHKPYIADTPVAIMLKQINDPLPRPRYFAPDLPEVVEKVIIKALAKKPENRYPSMEEFITALENLLSIQTKTKQSVLPWKKVKAEKSTEPEQNIPTLPEQIGDQVTWDARSPKGEKPSEPIFTPIEPAKTRLVSPGKPPVEALKHTKIKIRPVWVIALVALVALIAITVWGPHLLAVRPPYSSTASATGMAMSFVLTKTQFSTETPIPTEMLTEISRPTFTLVPTLGIGSIWDRPADGMVMVYVPAGNFSMGSNSGNPDEGPVHTVYLDAYWIDKTDVTNLMYVKCVSAGACQTPTSPWMPGLRALYYGELPFDNYPIIFVTWNDAQAYCQWAGSQLPTEAEWEKAALGTDGRTYPWGSDTPTCSLANFAGCKNAGDFPTAVGSYTAGASPYGALDMAGNVWDWVNDWYSDTYYGQSSTNNPTGPLSGIDHVLRGSAWNSNEFNIRSSIRKGLNPSSSDGTIGFRCSRSQ